MNDSKQQDQNQAQDKKPYERPELVKHGNVESQTQGTPTGPSGPINPN